MFKVIKLSLVFFLVDRRALKPIHRSQNHHEPKLPDIGEDFEKSAGVEGQDTKDEYTLDKAPALGRECDGPRCTLFAKQHTLWSV